MTLTKEEFKMSEMLSICIIMGIFSVSLFVLAFISGREIDMITLIPSSLILAVTAFAVGHSYYVDKQYEFCPNCHFQYQVYEQYDYCPQCSTKLTNKCDNCHKELQGEATKACPYCGKEIEFKVGDIPNDSN